MSDIVATITIEMKFGKGLAQSVDKAQREGENVSIQSIVDDLAAIYRKTVRDTPQFTRPLKALDKKVKISVTSKVLV